MGASPGAQSKDIGAETSERKRVKNSSADFRTFKNAWFQNVSERFRTFQNVSDRFRTFQNVSELEFRTFPPERKRAFQRDETKCSSRGRMERNEAWIVTVLYRIHPVKNVCVQSHALFPLCPLCCLYRPCCPRVFFHCPMLTHCMCHQKVHKDFYILAQSGPLHC